ncbi:MAG: [FeFe] hydrogenase H-cluster radical SAM maturase HydG [Candidatus Omnitrophica bacterium]|nr:[FeFe] hydrogenase H-cluster radical SAM maturase HydG [Candidatus Omnitrophota bacterium]
MSEKTATLENWATQRINFAQISPYLNNMRDFICETEIEGLLRSQTDVPASCVHDIIQKALAIETLSLKEAAILLNVRDKDLLSRMREAALAIKTKVYDNRIVTFAPFYTGNLCVNNCLYCGFRSGNPAINRKLLTVDEIKNEIEIIAGSIGHKRIIAVYGEHPESGIDYIISTMSAIYNTKIRTKNNSSASIRRVNVNAAPMQVEELRALKKAGIGTYQVFQETYHHKTYESIHPRGTVKSNYRWRLYSMHRAIEAGIDDVGIGALFGLYDWKFEIMGLLAHARELEKTFGIGPHTVSFPRLEPALNTPFAKASKYLLNDETFKKVITVLRLCIPYAGMILTARENASMRRDCFSLGITQTDASSKIGIGSYSQAGCGQKGNKQQFLLADTRSLDEVVLELAQDGFITSFCTAGYRCERTGKCIMKLLRSGQEGKFCKLNAVLTFREWLDDFASPRTKEIAENIINREISQIKSMMPDIFPAFMNYYERITQGERDLYF